MSCRCCCSSASARWSTSCTPSWPGRVTRTCARCTGSCSRRSAAAASTAAELGRRLGISKQAAGKIIDGLLELGYVERGADPQDARRKVVRLTDRGFDCLARSARIFDDLRAGWAARLGPGRLRALEHDLRQVTPPGPVRLDVPGWFGG